jgi:hypothetical protein
VKLLPLLRLDLQDLIAILEKEADGYPTANQYTAPDGISFAERTGKNENMTQEL